MKRSLCAALFIMSSVAMANFEDASSSASRSCTEQQAPLLGSDTSRTWNGTGNYTSHNGYKSTYQIRMHGEKDCSQSVYVTADYTYGTQTYRWSFALRREPNSPNNYFPVMQDNVVIGSGYCRQDWGPNVGLCHIFVDQNGFKMEINYNIVGCHLYVLGSKHYNGDFVNWGETLVQEGCQSADAEAAPAAPKN